NTPRKWPIHASNRTASPLRQTAYGARESMWKAKQHQPL
ncbi:MAG: hypothetical protein ACI9DF_001330, partial [Verrucomicrobiales bacterium]